MNLAINNKFERIYDLYEQIFDYFLLTYNDLNSEIENKYSVNEFKNKLETFADKHFLSAINDFNNEIQKLKNNFPSELVKLERISIEVQENFNQLVKYNLSNNEIISSLKSKIKDILIRIK